MKVGITGASGLVGRALLSEAKRRRWSTVAFSRNPTRDIPNADEIRSIDNPEEADFSGLDVLIHLAGENVAGLWTKTKKEAIFKSRVDLTDQIVSRLLALPERKRPEALISASGVGIYGDNGDELQDEDSDIGFSFLAKVCRFWERAVRRATDEGNIRTVSVRVGLVLDRRGGVLAKMWTPFRLGLGGRLGNGQHWMPWIHYRDLARIFLFCAENPSIHGPVNGVSPHPVTNEDFSHALAHSLGKKARFPVPAWLLRLLPGGFGDVLLESVRAEPSVLAAYGFEWEFPNLNEALEQIVATSENATEPEAELKTGKTSKEDAAAEAKNSGIAPEASV